MLSVDQLDICWSPSVQLPLVSGAEQDMHKIADVAHALALAVTKVLFLACFVNHNTHCDLHSRQANEQCNLTCRQILNTLTTNAPARQLRLAT